MKHLISRLGVATLCVVMFCGVSPSAIGQRKAYGSSNAKERGNVTLTNGLQIVSSPGRPTLNAPVNAGNPALSRNIRRTYSPERLVLAPGSANAAAANLAYNPQRALSLDIELVGQLVWEPGVNKSDFVYIRPDGSLETIGTASLRINAGGAYEPESNVFMGVYCPDQYGYFSGDPVLGIFDMETAAEVTRIDATRGLMGETVDRDPTTGEYYGYLYDDSGYNLAWSKVDYENGVRTIIRPVEYRKDCMALGCTEDGQFYGVNHDSQLVKINKEDGSQEVVGTTAFPTAYNVGSCINDENNTMLVYALANDEQSSALYEVDLATGATTKITSDLAPRQLYSLFIMPPKADKKAPKAPDLQIITNGAGLTVSYTVSMPTQLMEGTECTGSLDWQITADGVVKASGSASPGQSVSGSFSVDSEGMTTFIATASNEVGPSPEKKVKLFIGNDCPQAPQSVSVAYDSGEVSLVWEPVTSSMQGGYVDFSAVSYTVREGETVIAEGLSDSMYDYPLTEPDDYTVYNFTVTACYKGMESAPATAAPLRLGAYSTPFSTGFQGVDTFDRYGYTVVNANEDNATWKAGENAAVYRYDYTNPQDADDWIFTPSIRFENGKVYMMTLKLWATNAYSGEQIEVKLGDAPNPEAMTKTLLETTGITAGEWQPLELSIPVKVEADGKFNIGLHCVSPKYAYELNIGRLEISEGLDPSAAQAPTNLTIIPDEKGYNSVQGKFTMPTTTIGGDQLSGSLQAIVLRDGEIVNNYLYGNPGAEVSFYDYPSSKGDYTYTIYIVNNGSKGLDVSQTIYVGPKKPLDVTESDIFESHQPGTVTVTWTPVTNNIDYKPLDAYNVTYMVYGINNDGTLVEMLDEPTKKTNATFEAVTDPSKQQFVQYAIRAFYFGDVASDGLHTTDAIPVGNAYNLPVLYTSDESLEDFVIGSGDKFDSATWGIYSADITDVPGADGDDMYFGATAQYSYAMGTLFTGKISLIGAKHPQLVFHTYSFGNSDSNTVSASVMANGQSYTLGQVSHSSMSPGWNEVRYDLARFIGKNIQVKLTAFLQNYAYTFVDAISVEEMPEVDVAAVISGPTQVSAGEKFNIDVAVSNFGLLESGPVMVNLYRDGNLIDSQDVETIISSGQAQFAFETSLDYFDQDKRAVFHAVVVCDGDEVPGNDVSSELVVNRKVYDVPAVTDLDGAVSDEGARLTWSVYDPSQITDTERTESFENGEFGQNYYDNWTFIDVDGQPVGGYNGFDIPGITVGVTTSSFFLFDATQVNESYGISAHSGDKILCAMFRSDDLMVDDWMISPRLTGNAQTISFWARGSFDDYPEQIEIWYATGEFSDHTDFTLLEDPGTVTVGGEWSEVTAELPDGATYFAIRSRAAGGFMLMIDDVTFTPDKAIDLRNLLGYDVYRDGVRLNGTSVAAGEYVDTQFPKDGAEHTYHVVAKYAEGNSELSNPLVLSAFSSVAPLTGNSGLKVTIEGRCIIVDGADEMDVVISTVDGRVVYTTVGNIRLPVAPAVYLVTVGCQTFKLMVR